MIVKLEKVEPIEKAFARLRQAPLEATGSKDNILIYKNASMRICDFVPRELNPTSLYVLRGQLDMLRRLRLELLEQYQIDIFKLSHILHLRTEDGRLIGMAPPFVEFYEETVQILPLPEDRLSPPSQTVKLPIIKDGIHRIWLANEELETIRCIAVSGALQAYPPYAYPNAWSEVKVYDSKPEQKKFYRRHIPYSDLRPLKVLRQTGNEPPPPEWGR